MIDFIGRNVSRRSGIGGIKSIRPAHGGHNERGFLSGKPRRACPVLTEWATSLTFTLLQRMGMAYKIGVLSVLSWLLLAEKREKYFKSASNNIFF
jgi:hypothetical protein